MKERPILFSSDMIRALLDCRKTQTRRVCKPAQKENLSYVVDCGKGKFGDEEGDIIFKCPFGIVGDQLWVRETWSTHACFDEIKPSELKARSIHYWADGEVQTGKKRPSIFMPRNLSRILLEITNVCVERLHDISVEDAKAEGIEPIHWPDLSIKYPDYVSKIKGRRVTNLLPKQSYFTLWESINGRKSLEDNPFVWALSFKVVEIKR